MKQSDMASVAIILYYQIKTLTKCFMGLSTRVFVFVFGMYIILLFCILYVMLKYTFLLGS